ncbi:MAG: PaREP1 family protein [Thermoprotei archaeon]
MLGIDPKRVAEVRLEVAERMFREAEEYVAKGDPVQASEKIYKAVEECIKALAEVFRVKVLEDVEGRGKWETWLLGKASRELAEKLSEEKISLAWSKAYEIHVWGFHENKYSIEDIRIAIPITRWLLEQTRKNIREIGNP